MRKIIAITSTLALVSILLVACAGQQTETSVPATTFPTNEPATSAPTGETPVGTETSVAGTGTAVGGIPVTGENDPGRLSNELDYNVYNQNGDQIGEVDDMVVDLDNNMVAYVVVGTGGFLDIGQKQILVPWDQLALQTGANSASPDQYAFVLQADQQMFENAPDVDLNSILPGPGQSANDWDAQLRDYWQGTGVPSTTGTGTSTVPGTSTTGTPAAVATDTPAVNMTATPATGTSATAMPGANGNATGQLQGVVLATDLLGANITIGANGEMLNNNATPGTAVGTDTPGAVSTLPAATAMPAGTGTATTGTGTTVTGTGTATTGTASEVNTATIDDVIVDTNTGDIMYFVLSADFSDGAHLVPVPPSQFSYDTATQGYLLNATQAMFGSAPFFQNGEYPDTTTSGWDSDYSSYWQ